MQVEQFLTIVEPAVTTPRAFAQRDGRGLPFASLTATTDETAAVTLVAVVDAAGAEIEGVFDIRDRGADADLVVDYRCVDRGGDTVSFALPATFIDDEFAHGTGAADAPARLRQAANAAARLARREVDLGGQRVSYADPLAGSQTSKATHRFRLAWEGPVAGVAEDDLHAARDVAVYGVLEDADVVHEMAGSATGATGATVGVTLHDRWLDGGNDAGDNFDLAFLKLAESVSSLIGGGSAVGGVAQFDLLAEVYNQSAGVGLDLPSADAPWDPDKLLGDASKIVGNIALSQVIEVVENALPGLDIPGTTVTVDGNAVTVEFTFCPTLHDLPAVGFRTVPGKTRCCLHVTTVASLDDSIEASFETEMRVENFFLDFPPVIDPALVVVDVESVVATISSDGATSIVPTVRSWDFSGLLSMLMALVDKLGLGNVDLKVSGDLIDIDSSINVPDIALGVAEIKNFAINIGVELPLGDGAGQLSIGIGSKAGPLDIDVLMFGATFWLDIDLGFSGGPATPDHDDLDGRLGVLGDARLRHRRRARQLHTAPVGRLEAVRRRGHLRRGRVAGGRDRRARPRVGQRLAGLQPALRVGHRGHGAQGHRQLLRRLVPRQGRGRLGAHRPDRHRARRRPVPRPRRIQVRGPSRRRCVVRRPLRRARLGRLLRRVRLSAARDSPARPLPTRS